MNKFRELLLSVSAEPSTVIHLGAGSCSEIDFYQSLAIDRIIFTEPDPELADIAANKLKDRTGVSIVAVAVTTGDDRQVLNITNNKRFSSLLTPTGLLDFYPNIEIINRIKVDTTTLEKLCQDAGIDDSSDNLLVVEAQGLEKEILPAAATDVLQSFKWVIIRSSNEDIYKPSKNSAQISIQQAMLNAHFTVLVFNEDTPPFINFLCIRNDSALSNKQLKARETDLLEIIDGFEGEAAILQDQLKLLDDANKSQLKQVKELSSSIISRSDELELAHTTVSKLSAENEKLLKQTEKLTNSLAQNNIEFTEIQQTLRINNKLMLKSDTDLKDLQLQYRNVLQHQEQQNALLGELKAKLRQASEFYKSLNLQNLVLDGNMLEQVDSGEDK